MTTARSTLYYAFVGPWVRRPLGPGEFGYVERSGIGGILLGLGLVAVIEGGVAHLLLSAAHPVAAWILAGLNVYGLVWIMAAFQAARLLPVVLSSDCLLARASLLWTAAIPRHAIASVARIDEMPRGKGTLRIAFGATPELLITFTEPVAARGPLGIQRSVSSVALYVDEAEKLRVALGAP